MSSIGSNQSSKRWELVSIAECESSGLLVTFFMAWSPGRRLNAGDSRLITTETTPPSIPTNPATGPFDDLWLAGAVSAWWLGSVEGQAAVWASAETRWQEAEVDLRHGDAKESAAAQVLICVVDPRDGGD